MPGPSAENNALQRIKRFYKGVAVKESDEGHLVTLDLKPVRTPRRAPLAAPTAAAAQMIADEWAAQEEFIDFHAMPATRHAFTAIDRVSVNREEVAKETARYAGSDLLCYFAEAPERLVERQTEKWGPLLDWAEKDLGLRFERTAGISPMTQPASTLRRVEALALDLDDFRLAGLAFGGALFGSSILGLALEKGRLSGEEAFELSRLDEAFQEEEWGVDEEAAERTAGLLNEAVLLDRWLRALAE